MTEDANRDEERRNSLLAIYELKLSLVLRRTNDNAAVVVRLIAIIRICIEDIGKQRLNVFLGPNIFTLVIRDNVEVLEASSTDTLWKSKLLLITERLLTVWEMHHESKYCYEVLEFDLH